MLWLPCADATLAVVRWACFTVFHAFALKREMYSNVQITPRHQSPLVFQSASSLKCAMNTQLLADGRARFASDALQRT